MDNSGAVNVVLYYSFVVLIFTNEIITIRQIKFVARYCSDNVHSYALAALQLVRPWARTIGTLFSVWNNPIVVSRPEEAEEEEEKGLAFSCSCMHVIISYLSMCIHGGGGK